MDFQDKFEEWFFQSDYDLETAMDMFDSNRHIYCIFMCHLSLEKALKGLYVKKTGEYPSRTHSLLFFIEKMNLDLSQPFYEFIYMLNKISVPTRYPDDLRKLFKVYSKEMTLSVLEQTKKLQLWIKQQ